MIDWAYPRYPDLTYQEYKKLRDCCANCSCTEEFQPCEACNKRPKK